MQKITDKEQIIDVIWSLVHAARDRHVHTKLGYWTRCKMSIERPGLLYVAWPIMDEKGKAHDEGLSILLEDIEEVTLDRSEFEIRGTFDCVLDRKLTMKQTPAFRAEFLSISSYNLAEMEIIEDAKKSESLL